MELPRKTRGEKLDLVVATCAVFISVVSLVIGFYEARTQQSILSASTWPYLNLISGNENEGRQDIQFTVENAGVGPAILKSLEITYRGKPASNVYELLRTCCNAPADPRRIYLITDRTANRVIAAHDRLTYVEFPLRPQTASIWKRFDATRAQLRVRACYCSVLGKCWLAEAPATLTEVYSCPPLVAFRS